MMDAAPTNPFPPVTEAAWRAAVDRVLKGADFSRKLVGRTADGLEIQPLYPRRGDAAPVVAARSDGRWRVAARVDHPDPIEANRLALADLEGGADALSLVFHGALGARGFGLPSADTRELELALTDVEIDLIAIRLEPPPQARIVARQFAELVKRRRLNPADLDVCFGFDPLGLLARSGVLMAPWPDVGLRLRDMLAEFGEPGFKGPFIACDARAVHEAGGSEAQELAWLLSATVAYLRVLESAGVALDTAFPQIGYTLAVDADEFLGIAKLRALRRLLARLQEAAGLPDTPARIHAETAWRMLTRNDVPVNMLRNTIAAFSAAVGGADSLAVLPHTFALGLPEDFARRIARNAQLVLMEESQLGRVADPAAGSGGIEALTDGLCAAAWAEFQNIEREGGLVAALTAGAFQRRVAKAREARARDIATGRQPLTGATAFPTLAEAPQSVLDIPPQAPRKVEAGAVLAEALPSIRLAEPFERFRARADALAESGQRPAVFLATLGKLADFTPRAGFARGLFEAGGLAAPLHAGFAEADGGTDLVAMTEAFKASGGTIACICGSDDAYAAEAADAAMALAASGAAQIWLAGRPGEQEAALRAAGVGGFIFAGCDMLAVLEEALGAATQSPG